MQEASKIVRREHEQRAGERRREWNAVVSVEILSKECFKRAKGSAKDPKPATSCSGLRERSTIVVAGESRWHRGRKASVARTRERIKPGQRVERQESQKEVEDWVTTPYK